MGTKIFATAPTDAEADELRIFVDTDETKACVAEAPDTFSELWWGKSLAGVGVRLSTADPARVAELLDDSYRRKATKKLIAELDGRSS